MPTIANLPAADIRVDLGGEIITINLVQMLVSTQNAEFKRDHGMFLPGVAKLRPTLRAEAERYGIDPRYARTWAELADTLREVYNDLRAAVDAHYA